MSAAATARGSRLSVAASTSTNTGRAPACTIASAVKAAESEVVTTSSPAPMPSARSARCSASVPFADGDGVARPERRGELALERLDLGPEDEPAGVEHARDRGVDLAAQRGDVRAEVDEGNGRSLHR